MTISQETINQALEIYKPEARCLRRAELVYPLMKGEFQIPPTFYTKDSLKHATDIEIQLCLNQLAYAGIAEAIDKGLIPNLRQQDFNALREEGMLIIESRKRFRKPIRTDRPIFGELKLLDFRGYKKLIIGNLDFQFENRSCIGSLELAICKNGEMGK